ncbi:hypothetical protein M1116_00210 [Patescibacteria group bacterium]|nr:hypothetical protein [Patescibacteria group bacterium]
MIQIFHGDHTATSRQNFNQAIDTSQAANILRLDAKETTLDKVNLFLNSTSLFPGDRLLAISNFFSVPKALLDKITPILTSSPDTVILWHDKKLSAAQTKLFSQAKIVESPLPKTLFVCLNTIKPGNLKILIPLLRQTLKSEPYDLFLYLLKGNLRKQLQGYSKFDPLTLKRAYLSLVELDYQTKTGTLAIAKEIALERILVQLVK